MQDGDLCHGKRRDKKSVNYYNRLLVYRRLQILIIDDNVAPLTLAVIRCLGCIENLDIHILNLNNLIVPSFRFSKYVRSYTSKMTSGDEEVYALIRNTAEKVKADIIVPVKEKTVRIVAERLSWFLEFTRVPPMPDPQTLDLVRNKWLLNNWLYEKNHLADRPLRYSDVIKTPEVLEKLGYPVMIKPDWGSGGRGIKLIRNKRELINFVPNRSFKKEELLIQKYIAGFDIDISVLTENGGILAYVIQRDISGKEKMTYSRSIEFVRQDALLANAASILKDLNYTGIAHLDFRFDRKTNSFSLIDFNARFWSSLLGSLNSGLNFPWLFCRKALHENLAMPEYLPEKYYVTNNLFKIVSNGVSIRQSELRYTLRDPLPFFFEIGEKASFFLKKLFTKNSSQGL